MPLRDRIIALCVAACWGLNFPAIHLSLEQFPPFFLVAVRFALLAVPTVLFVPRPAVPLRWLLSFGMCFGVLQFAFLYLAMAQGMPTGLASLVLQASAPFTVLLGAAWLRERITGRQGIGIGLAVLGLGGIAALRAVDGASAGFLPVVLCLCGGLGWALGNLASRQAHPDNPLRLTLWMSVIPPLPLAVLALLLDGPEAIGRSVTTIGTATGAWAIAGLAYTVLVATVLGSGAWTALLSRHPSGTVAPFSMLVPVVGIAASWLLLGEQPRVAELALGALVVGGVLIGAQPRRAAQPLEPTGKDVPDVPEAAAVSSAGTPAGTQRRPQR